MTSPRRRGFWALLGLALLAVVGGFFLFVNTVLVDDRRRAFPESDETPPAPREAPLDLTSGWVDRAPRTVEDALRAHHPEAAVRDLPGRRGWVRATLGEEPGRVRRTALSAPSGALWEWSGFLPVGARLETHVGFLSDGAAGSFTVEIVDDRGPRVVWTDTVVPRRHRAVRRWRAWLPGFARDMARRSEHAEERWRPVRVDLASAGGRFVRLRLRTTMSSDGEAAGGLGLWAAPVVWSPRALVTPRRVIAERLLIALLERARGDRVSLEGVADEVPDRLGSFLRESVVFQRCYTPETEPHRALADFWGARVEEDPAAPPPLPWPAYLRSRGWRTTAIGAFDDRAFEILDAAGVDVIRQLPRDGYEPLAAAAVALDMERRERGRAGHVTLAYFGDLGPGRLAPARFWTFSLRRNPGAPRRWRSWRSAAAQDYTDHYMGGLLDGAGFAGGPLTAVLSLGGVPGSAFPARWTRSDRRGWVWSERSGRGMKEKEIRALFAVRGELLSPTVLADPPSSLAEAMPTLMGLLGVSRDPRRGARAAFAAPRRDEGGVRVVVRGDGAKALIVDGRYKYVRRAPAGAAGPALRRGVEEDFAPEELFDLWADPGETRNLAGARRTLLARARQVLDESDPDPIDVHLAFWNPGGQTVTGVVTCSAGRVRGVEGTVPLARRGAYEFSFSTTATAGRLVFDTWPPAVAYMMRLTVGGRFLPVSQWRVSALGRPFFESVGDQWHDRTKFAWMEGAPPPLPSTGTLPLAALGRVARPPAPLTDGPIAGLLNAWALESPPRAMPPAAAAVPVATVATTSSPVSAAPPEVPSVAASSPTAPGAAIP
jgi:hypothetical protein